MRDELPSNTGTLGEGKLDKTKWQNRPKTVQGREKGHCNRKGKLNRGKERKKQTIRRNLVDRKIKSLLRNNK